MEMCHLLHANLKWSAKLNLFYTAVPDSQCRFIFKNFWKNIARKTWSKNIYKLQ